MLPLFVVAALALPFVARKKARVKSDSPSPSSAPSAPIVPADPSTFPFFSEAPIESPIEASSEAPSEAPREVLEAPREAPREVLPEKPRRAKKAKAEPARSKKETATFSSPKDELVTKVAALVEKKFGGDYKKAFEAYSNAELVCSPGDDGVPVCEGDGAIGLSELEKLLADAKVGNAATRSMWAQGIMSELDTNGDRLISWSEFSKVLS